MTREQLNKHWEVIDAWRKGEDIEYFDVYLKNWYPASTPIWAMNFEYRIKPAAPKYIPFDFTDAEFLIGKVVKSKVSDWAFMITSCNSVCCYTGNTGYMYGELLSNFTFLDDNPCGKLKQ